MSLHAALGLFVEQYPLASKSPFPGNPVADFIRNDIPEAIQQVIGTDDRYLIHGSPGQGNWARVPWAAVFDRLVTDTAQDGYYIVYLVREDFAGVYLSLNQGVTSIKAQYGVDSKSALRVRAADYLARLGKYTADMQVGPIDLAANISSSLGSLYEQGSICALYYPKHAIPHDHVLNTDLLKFMHMYQALASLEDHLYEKVDCEEDERNIGVEDLRVLREHKRIERNKKLSLRAKKVHGYVCKVCGFDFQKCYGDLGKEFIEAHHLTPLSLLNGSKITLDATVDFTVLCANCHRMIHRSEFVNKVEAFRAKYLALG